MKTTSFALAAAFLLAACGPSEPAQELTGQGYLQGSAASEVAVPVEATTDIQATGFYTENLAAPEGAGDKGDGIPRDANSRPFHYALLGQRLPAFTAPVTDGSTFDSTQLSRWTVIDVWGVWCGDCVRDGPYVAALERAIAQDPDLDFVSLHVPASAARTSPEELFKKYGSLDAYFESAGYSFPVVLDHDASIRQALQISWTPTYLLVSPDGVVRGFRTDLSVDQDQPIKTFLQNVAEVRKDVRDLLATDPSDIE